MFKTASGMASIRDTLSGFSGAVALVYCGLPFDTVKLRMQTSTAYSGVVNVFQRMLAEEGALSLWKGAVPALSSALVENGVVFTVNGFLRRANLFGGVAEEDLTLLQHAALGGIAGCFSATAITPFEVLKCRMQYQRNAAASAASGSGSGSAPAASVLTMAMHVIRQEGVRGCFAGLTPLLLRDVPFNTLFFGSYRTYTYLLRQASGLVHGDDTPGHHAFLCGGLAGMTAWSVVFPADALKSRMQVHGLAHPDQAAPSMVATARGIWAEGGARLLYRGWSAAVLRAFPANAALFWGVEMADALLRKWGL